MKVKIMQKLTTLILMVTLSFALAGCYESSSEELPPPAIALTPTGPVVAGLAADGSTYYQSNCATCHKAGQDDPTSAFGAADLAQRHDMIATDMSNYDSTSGFNMMNTYSNVSEQRVDDLKAYFESVAN
jgi:cytochrome c5